MTHCAAITFTFLAKKISISHSSHIETGTKEKNYDNNVLNHYDNN